MERWRRRELVVRPAFLVGGLLASVPILILFLDAPPELLAACSNYYSSPPPCGGCASGSVRPLCCVVVRAPFHPDPGPQCIGWQECCGPNSSPQCGRPPGCTASRGIPTSAASGTPTGDGTTGLCATPKYKSTSAETVTFFGFVRICPGSSGDQQQSWICAENTAEVYLDAQPHDFMPECVGGGITNFYCPPCPQNTTGSGWRDGLCPLEINLASKLQDYKWHPLKIVYTNNSPVPGLNYHLPCCQDGTYFGMTLFLGCEIEVRDTGLTIPRIAVPSKFQRVNLYGVPVPERSPTGEAESDEPQDGFFIDVYNLAPSASFPEMSIPLEGGELALEFRRNGGVRTAHTSTYIPNLPITYPTDDLLGLGWSSNLSARAIISRSGACGPDPPRVTITDSGGTVYQYLLEPGNKFRPEFYEAQANAAISAIPALLGSNLTLTLKHGTQYKYTKVGTFVSPNGNTTSTEEYFRLDWVLDRNGNKIVHEYATSGIVSPAGSMLVSAIYEAAHPERKLLFTYEDVLPLINQNGYDWGIRLIRVTDPLGNFIQYEYTSKDFGDNDIPLYSRQRRLLTKVTYPLVQVGDSSQNLNPTQNYEYELRVTEASRINSMTFGEQPPPPLSRILHVGLKEAWQNGNANVKTVFTYALPGAEPEFPVAIHPIKMGGGGSECYCINVETQKVLSLTSVQTADNFELENGIETHFATSRSILCEAETPPSCPASPCELCPFASLYVETQVTDPRGTTIKYDWAGVARPLGASTDPTDATGAFLYWNQVGFATVIHQLERLTMEGTDVFASVRYEYSDNLLGNLLKVVDMSGNRIKYTYGNLSSQKSNLPTRKEVSKNIDPPEPTPPTLSTNYEYGAFNKLSKVTDAEGKVTRFSFDLKGNRIELVNESMALGDRTTAFSYTGVGEPSDGFVFSTTDAEGHLTTFSRQFNTANLLLYNNVTTIVDPNGLALKTVKTYDVAGNLRKEIPPEGFVPGHNPDDYATTYEYDALNRLKRVTKPQVLYDGSLAATIEESFYDLKGNLVKKKAARDPLGQDVVKTDFSYDSMNRLRFTTVIASPNPDIVTEKRYNYMGLLWQEVDAKFNEVTLTYDTLLRLRYKNYTVTMDGVPQSLQEQYQYETSAGERLNSGSGAFAYNIGWKPIRVWNPMGFATDSTFDEFYRLVQVVRRRDSPPADPSEPGRGEEIVEGFLKLAEPQENTQYDDGGKVVKRTVVLTNSASPPILQESYMFYDDFNRATATVLELDGNSSPYHQPEAVRINSWAELDTIYHNNLPGDIYTFTSYDKTDKVLQAQDPNGSLTNKTYDSAGRLTDEIGPAVAFNGSMVSPRVTSTYDTNGAVVEKRGPYPDGSPPGGNLVRNYYDKQGRLEKTIVDLDGDGLIEEASDITTKINHDLIGNRREEIDANGNATAFVYDGANRKITVLGPEVLDAEFGLNDIPQTTFQYDKNSNMTATVDARGVITKFEYDELNRVVAERKAADTLDELVTEKAYDQNGNLTELLVRNRVGGVEELQATSYEYDPFDRLVREEPPGDSGQFKVYQHHRDGKLRLSIDFMLQGIEYQYDLARRKAVSLHKKFNGTVEETRSFVYDKAGNVLTVSDANGTSTYGYDSLYRVTSETRQTAGEPSHTIQSEYDLDGRRTKVTYPSTNRVITAQYDPAGRLAAVIDGTVSTSYRYDKNGNVTRQRWPADLDSTYVVETANTFDALNRLDTRVTTKRVDASVLYSADFGYDLVGNIRTLSEGVNGQSRALAYNYDPQYRLTSEYWTGTAYAYTYDAIGNRLTKTHQGVGTYQYDYDFLNQLCNRSPVSRDMLTSSKLPRKDFRPFQ